MSAEIIIFLHAINRYRERNEGDSLRMYRKNNHIEEMIRRAVISHKFWPVLEEISEEGICGRTELQINVSDLNGYQGVCRVPLQSRGSGRGYAILTVFPSS